MRSLSYNIGEQKSSLLRVTWARGDTDQVCQRDRTESKSSAKRIKFLKKNSVHLNWKELSFIFEKYDSDWVLCVNLNT